VFAATALIASVVVVAADAQPSMAAFPGENGKIVFTRYDESNGPTGKDIWVVSANGTGLTRLTFTPDEYEQWPSWSPDGSKIAFVVERAGSGIYQVWVMDQDGANQRQVTDLVGTGGAVHAAWSPDGTQIVIEVDPKGVTSTDLFVVNVDGSGLTQITDYPGSEFAPTWSPEGTRIAFTSSQSGDIWTVAPDGSNLTQMTNLPVSASHPGWSPDGSRIAFQSYQWPTGRIWIVDADGTDAKLMTADGSNEIQPAWSPDGTRLVYNNDGQLWFMNTDGTERTSVGVDGMEPDWQPVPVIPQPVGLIDPATGIWRIAGADGALRTFYYGDPGDVPFVGDWDGDGVDTPGLFRASDAFAYLRNSNTQGIADIRFFFGNQSDVPLAGDFNGDGYDTLAIYRPSEARFYIINELGENEGGLGDAEYSFQFGNLGDKPVVGDWDGDGIDEVGLHRETTGFFYYRNTLTTGVADWQFYFGNPGDRFVAGDWGVVDGVETPAVYRPSNRTFYFRYTLTQGNADYEFAWPGPGTDWLPVAGNFTLD
jgi:dipeptidyl aminopeptidase/acylaminoacyl peptidase